MTWPSDWASCRTPPAAVRARWTAGWRRRASLARAECLPGQKSVQKLYYPGLPSHPQHELAKRQMSGFGGMISFDLGDTARAKRFVAAGELFVLAAPLG